MSFWEIETTIKPPVAMNSKHKKKSKYPFEEMKVGESVYIDGQTTQGNACIFAYNYARKVGKKFTAKTDDGGTRIWRIA